MPRTVAKYDRRIMVGYALLALIAVAAAYVASGGPGFSETGFAVTAALP